MQLMFILKSIAEKDTFILFLCIGLLEALKNKTISIRDAEVVLFSPYTVSILRKNELSESVIDIIERGCELEDIESLIPDKLHFKIDHLISLCFMSLGDFNGFDYKTVEKFISNSSE